MTIRHLRIFVAVAETGKMSAAAERCFVTQPTVSQAIRELEENTGRTYEKLYIVGGGAKNQFLNRLTAELTGKEVVALPIEATALGNLNIQFQYWEEMK